MNPLAALMLLLGVSGTAFAGKKLLSKYQLQPTQPTLQPVPSPTPTIDPLQQRIQKGFEKYSPDTPMATMSAQLAQLGKQLPHPELPAALSLKESSGLRDLPGNQKMREYNNPFGIMYGGELIKYPDLPTSILGGGNMGVNGKPQQGLQGTINSNYQDYLESGELEDFLKTYTPPGGVNPSMEEQLAVLNELLSYFKE